MLLTISGGRSLASAPPGLAAAARGGCYRSISSSGSRGGRSTSASLCKRAACVILAVCCSMCGMERMPLARRLLHAVLTAEAAAATAGMHAACSPRSGFAGCCRADELACGVLCLSWEGTARTLRGPTANECCATPSPLAGAVLLGLLRPGG